MAVHWRRVEHPMQVSDQLTLICADVCRKCNQSSVNTPERMALALAVKVEAGEALAIAWVAEPQATEIKALFVVEVRCDEWLGTRFALVSFAWSRGRLTADDYAALDGVFDRCAEQLGLTEVRFESARSASAWRRLARRYVPMGTVFSRKVVASCRH